MDIRALIESGGLEAGTEVVIWDHGIEHAIRLNGNSRTSG